MSWAAGEGLQVELIFDGTHRAPSRAAGSVQVRYAGSEGVASADALIERRVREAVDFGWACDVVSDDHGVRSVVSAAADRVLSCAAFVRALAEDNPVHHLACDAVVDTSGPGASRLLDHMDPATRAAFERMRRNQ